MATAAHATAEIGPERIVVGTPSARAVIETAPFRIAFQGPKGGTFLDQVENTEPRPSLLLPSTDPELTGTDNLSGPTLYSPLTFTVGARANLQFPATQWVGNQLVGTETGVQYAATEVLAAEPRAQGAVLTLATNDPSGREIELLVEPRGELLAVEAEVTPEAGVVSISDSFTSPPQEAFRGFGGRHNTLDQRGNSFYSWVEQQNVGAGPFGPATEVVPGTGGDTYLFPNGPTAAFYVQAQFISSRGYGFLLDRSELSGWRLASDRDDAWQVSIEGNEIDYLLATGGARPAIRRLTEVSGRHPVPPGWALGPQLDRLTRFSGETVETYSANLEADLRDIERFELPLRAYRIEAWAWLEPDYLRSVIDRLHERGIKALLYFRPFVGRDEIGTDLPRYFDEAVENEWVATTATGAPFVFVGNFFSAAAMIDFTDPGAREWWRGRIRDALELGADGFMQDFGEQITNDMHFDNGETGATMHNRYPRIFHRLSRTTVDAYEREHPGRRIWFFTRTGFSGSPGSAPDEGGNFPGDETTDWSRSSGLASLTTDMLNRGIGGAFGYGTDIGGYFDFTTPPTSRELFLRWAQWSVLSPLMRLHGSIQAGTHTPWSYDPGVVRIYNRLSRLRLAAVPLIRELWQRAERTGMPIARPMWLQFPGDPIAAGQDQQWMLGPDVLVAPVVEEGARSREVYFPRGCWRSPLSGESLRGPRTQTVSAPLRRLLYYFRCGTEPIKTSKGAR